MRQAHHIIVLQLSVLMSSVLAVRCCELQTDFTETSGGEKFALTMPCCSESLGATACQKLAKKKSALFQSRCKNDADFGMVQCCKTCKNDVAELGRELFVDGIKSKHCFDRQNRKFCLQFLQQTEMWSGNGNQMSCNGDSAPLAFRICRRTCGFCDFSLYDDEKYPKSCPKLMDNTRLSFMEPVPAFIYSGQR